jgi:hypothetical protein
MSNILLRKRRFLLRAAATGVPEAEEKAFIEDEYEGLQVLRC